MRIVKKYFIGFWLLLLMIIEWVFDLVKSVWDVVHKSIQDLTIAMQNEYNDIKILKGEPDRGKE